MLAQHLLERANERGGDQKSGSRPGALGPDDLRLAGKPARARSSHRPRPLSSQGDEPLVAVEDLPASIRGNLGGGFSPPRLKRSIKPLDELLTEVERRLIETALRQARGNKSRSRRVVGDLPAPSLSPDQGAQPPRRRESRRRHRDSCDDSRSHARNRKGPVTSMLGGPSAIRVVIVSQTLTNARRVRQGGPTFTMHRNTAANQSISRVCRLGLVGSLVLRLPSSWGP